VNPRYPRLEITTGFEIRTDGAHELAFLLIELCPTVWAGTFDLFEIGGVSRVISGGRHEACRPVALYRNILQGGRGSSPRPPGGLQRLWCIGSGVPRDPR